MIEREDGTSTGAWYALRGYCSAARRQGPLTHKGLSRIKLPKSPGRKNQPIARIVQRESRDFQGVARVRHDFLFDRTRPKHVLIVTPAQTCDT